MLKNIFTILVLLISFSFCADYKPFYFENVANNSISQQNEFDYMLKYKLFGKEYIKVGDAVEIPDKSGWNGTAGDFTSGPRLILGGPVLVKGDIKLNDQQKIITGPIRAKSFTMGNNNGSILSGTMCLDDENVSETVKGIVKDSKGVIVNSSDEICKEVPEAPINLTIPTIKFPDTTNDGIIFSDINNDIQRIIVPDGDYEDSYDIYLDKIEYKKDNQKLIVQMQDGGRLTRIFVKDFIYHDHGGIQIEYRTEEGNRLLEPKEYRGNLLIYTNNDISISNSDNKIIQGTIISTGKIYLACNINLSGQLIANELEIGNTYHGENFIFMPFDKKTIDIDPELNKNGGLKENDSTVIIPIKLSDTASVDVYFSYCFELNSNVGIGDFNIEGLDFPICGEGEPKQVIIKSGQKYPSDTIKVNVKVDDLVEPNDTLVVRIKIESGAVLPGDKTEGTLKIKISDSDQFYIDNSSKYSIDENKFDVEVGKIVVVGNSENTRYNLVDTTDYIIDSISGVLTIKTPLDYEKQQKDTVWLVITDGSKKDSNYVVIDVNDVNEKPIVKDTTFKVDENNNPNYVIGTIDIDDEDINVDFRNNVVIQKENNQYIKVDSLGNVIALKKFDYESQDSVIVIPLIIKDKNDEKLSKECEIRVNIRNVNEPIVTVTELNEVRENSEVGTFVGSVSGKDLDNSVVSYTISGKEFTIDENGIIKTNMVFDYESKNTYQVIVTTKSTDGSEKKDTLTIKIKNVNEPVEVKDATFTIKENDTGNVGKVQATDKDLDKEYGTIHYSISDTSKYRIDEYGNVFVKVPFDYEIVNSDTVKVYVNDGWNKDSSVVIINVKDVNEEPKLIEDKFEVNENYVGVLDTVVAIDPDIDGKLKYDVLENEIYSIDSNGVIQIIKPFDYETINEASVTVIVSDGEYSDTLVYKVTINNVNEPLTVKDSKFEVEENYVGVIGKVEATDEDGDSIIYSISDTTKYKIDENGVITLLIPFDYETSNSDSLTVYVTDGENVDSCKVHISVKDVLEKSDVVIVRVNTEDSIYTGKDLDNTIFTNDKEIDLTYKTDDNLVPLDTTFTLHEGKNELEVCYKDPKKNEKGCDKVVVYYSGLEPIITVTTINKNDVEINGLTIVQESDSNKYVNKENNDIKITVKDPSDSKNDTSFVINVDLKPINVPSNVLKNLTIEPETHTNIKGLDNKVVGKNKIEVTKEVEVKIDGKPTKVTMVYYTDSNGTYIEEIPYNVSYEKNVNGQKVVISYNSTGISDEVKEYSIKYKQVNNGDTVTVSYNVDTNGKIVKDSEGNSGFTIGYSYTNKYGNTGTSETYVVLDTTIPKVDILTPYEKETYLTNSVEVVWTVDGIPQDTLKLERLEKGVNNIVRCYMDKADNSSCDTVLVYMKNAKDIEIALINPITETNMETVKRYYEDGHKFNPKESYEIKYVDPKNDTIPEIVGVGLNVHLVMPSVSSTGGLATIDDMVQVVNGKSGILVDKNGNLKSGTSTGADGSRTISVDEYIDSYCTEEFKDSVKINGIENTSLWNVNYKMHLWIYNTIGTYVNDFSVTYNLNDTKNVNDAGILNFIIDLVPDSDGYLKSSEGKNLATSAYITKWEIKNISTLRCKLPEQEIGTKVKTTNNDLIKFGYKRPKSN